MSSPHPGPLASERYDLPALTDYEEVVFNIIAEENDRSTTQIAKRANISETRARELAESVRQKCGQVNRNGRDANKNWQYRVIESG